MKFLIEITAANKSDQKFFRNCRKYTKAILMELGFQSAALSVLLVRDKKMAEFNWKMMRHRGTTDVLSFSYLEKKGKVKLTPKILSSNPPVFLGEIILCLDTAARNAKEYGVSLQKECALYLCHGILHCLGLNDQTALGFSEMHKKQKRILNRIFSGKKR